MSLSYHAHFLSRMLAPCSCHSCAPTQKDWNDDNDDTILPPIHGANLLSDGKGNEISFSFTFEGDSSDTFDWILEVNPPKRVFPPVRTMLL